MSSVDEERTALIAALRERAHTDSPAHTLMRDAAAALESVSPRLVTSEADIRECPLGTLFAGPKGSAYRLRGWGTDWEDEALPVNVPNFSIQYADGHFGAGREIPLPATVLWSPAPEGSGE